MSPFASTCAGLEAMIEIARKRGDVAIASTLEGYLDGIRRMGGWGAEVSATMPTATRKPKLQSAESAPMTPAERARAYRQRHANRHGAVTETVTSNVTPRDGYRDDSSRLAPALSLSSLPKKEEEEAEEIEREQKDTQAESTREGERAGAVTRDASRSVTSRSVTSRRPSRDSVTGPEHPAGDLSLAPWAEGGAASVAMATGRKVGDVRAVWAQFVAHLSAEGRPITRAEWTRWVTREVNKPKPAAFRGNGARILQTDDVDESIPQ